MQTRNSADFDDAVRERLQTLTEDHPQAEIARKTGFGKHNVSRYLKGTKIPAEFCCAVVSGLGVNPSWLLAGEGTPYLSDVTSGTASMAGNLLELVQSMSEVAKMRLGALTGKTHRKVLRQLDDALRDYETLRERLNEQSRPILRELIGDYTKAVSKQDIERSSYLRRAAHQLQRLCEDDRLRREVTALDAYFAYINHHSDEALELQHKVFLGFLGEGQVGERVFVEAYNYARVLSEAGRFEQARGIVGATVELGRAEGNQSRYYALRAWRGWMDVQLGELRAGMNEILEVLPLMAEREARTVWGEALTAQLLAGTLNWRAAMKLGYEAVSRSARMLNWSFWLRDAESMRAVLDEFVGDEPWQVNPESAFAGTVREGLAVLDGDTRAYPRWRDGSFEAQKRKVRTGLPRFQLFVQGANMALMAGSKDAGEFVLKAEQELAQVAEEQLPDILYRTLHARNILGVSKDSRAKKWQAPRQVAEESLRYLVTAGYRGLAEYLPD